MEFFSKVSNFPFMATRKVWYTLSVVLMLVSFGSFFTRGLNLAIDFTGAAALLVDRAVAVAPAPAGRSAVFDGLTMGLDAGAERVGCTGPSALFFC